MAVHCDWLFMAAAPVQMAAFVPVICEQHCMSVAHEPLVGPASG